MVLLIFLAIVLLVVSILAGGYFLNQRIKCMYLYNIFGFWRIAILAILLLCFYVALAAAFIPHYKNALIEYQASMDSHLSNEYNAYQQQYNDRHWARTANVDSIFTLPFVVGGKIMDKKERMLTEQEFLNIKLPYLQQQYNLYPPDRQKYLVDRTIYIVLAVIIFLGTVLGYFFYNASKTSVVVAIPIFFYQLLAAHGLIIVVVWVVGLINDIQRKLQEPSGGHR